MSIDNIPYRLEQTITYGGTEETVASGPIGCMERCRDNSDCKVYSFVFFKIIKQSIWSFKIVNFQGFYFYLGYNVEACTLYSNIEDEFFPSTKAGTGGVFCKHPDDPYKDPTSFAGRKCENYDCNQQ